jgi:ectoine hydroxylase-related dioxygenase (phytanoyl-CoA dioxygenase family)
MLGRTLRPGTAAQELHADLPRDDMAPPMAGFILMVDDVRQDNGATRFVPGSHRWPEMPEDVMPDRRAAHDAEVVACGRAGSLIVFDASVWHGHTANTSDASRRSIQGYFIPRSAPSGFDLPARMRAETLARIGPLARYVLAA